MTPRAILLAWAESGGFAATHGARATNEAIVDDLLALLAREGVVIMQTLRVSQEVRHGALIAASQVRPLDPEPTPGDYRREA